jgi:hypothetical protein
MNNRDDKKALQRQNDDCNEHDQYAMGDGTKIDDAKFRYNRCKDITLSVEMPAVKQARKKQARRAQ